MTLNQLRILVAIVDAGYNITHAAERVHATQPGLSKQLKQLEEYLGLVLLVRRGKSLTGLTPAGERVVVHADQIKLEILVYTYCDPKPPIQSRTTMTLIGRQMFQKNVYPIGNRRQPQ